MCVCMRNDGTSSRDATVAERVLADPVVERGNSMEVKHQGLVALVASVSVPRMSLCCARRGHGHVRA